MSESTATGAGRLVIARGYLVAFAIVFFAVGVTIWGVPYSQLSMPDSVIGPGFVVAVLTAIGAIAWARLEVRPTILAVTAGAPAAVMARVIVDTMKDPTSHNLWPLEIVIAGIVGFGAALVGALIGRLLRGRRSSA